MENLILIKKDLVCEITEYMDKFRDPIKLYQIYGNIMYHRNGIYDRYFYTIRNSWEATYTLAKSMIKNNTDNPRDYLISNYIKDREKRKPWYDIIEFV